MELKQIQDTKGTQFQEAEHVKSRMRSVGGTTHQMGVPPLGEIAITSMPVRSASKLDMGRECAVSKKDAEHQLRPKYLQHNLWCDDNIFTDSSADWTHTARPLPSPPLHELANPTVMNTIQQRPDLFLSPQ